MKCHFVILTYFLKLNNYLLNFPSYFPSYFCDLHLFTNQAIFEHFSLFHIFYHIFYNKKSINVILLDVKYLKLNVI